MTTFLVYIAQFINLLKPKFSVLFERDKLPNGQYFDKLSRLLRLAKKLSVMQMKPSLGNGIMSGIVKVMLLMT